MSNDTKYWVLRISNFVSFFVNSWFLTKAIGAGFSTGTGSKHTTIWFVLFGISTLAAVPLYLFYRRAKAQRWHPTSHENQEQLEVETLAAYAAMEQKQKEAERSQPVAPSQPVPPKKT